MFQHFAEVRKYIEEQEITFNSTLLTKILTGLIIYIHIVVASNQK